MNQKRCNLLCMALTLTLSLCACTSSSSTSSQAPTNEKNTSQVSKEISETEKTSVSETSNAKDTSKENTVNKNGFDKTASIEETVLYEDDNIKITANELSYDNYSAKLNLLIENNSAEDLTVSTSTLRNSCNAINGYMVSDGYMYTDISAGKKANEELSFSFKQLSLYGIHAISEFQISFSITDSNHDTIFTPPVSIKTSAADSSENSNTYHQAINENIFNEFDVELNDFSESELYNQGGIIIRSEALLTKSDGEKAFLIEIENTSDQLVYGLTSDIRINNLKVYHSSWSIDSINPGCRRIAELPLSMLDSSMWAAVGITDIGSMDFSFSVEDENGEELIAPEKLHIEIPGISTAFDNTGDELYNNNGIRIISKGILSDDSEYSDDVHLLLMVENMTDSTIKISDVYNSLSVNGFMTSAIMYDTEVDANGTAVMDVEIPDYSLEDNQISGVDDITSIELSIELKGNDRKTIDEAIISVSR